MDEEKDEERSDVQGREREHPRGIDVSIYACRVLGVLSPCRLPQTCSKVVYTHCCSSFMEIV